MPVTLKRKKAKKEADLALARLQDLARERADRLGPYADQARDQALLRLLQARGWTAPRLEIAAQRVEDTVAPRVAEMLNTAAQKIEPGKTKRGVRAFGARRRRTPRALIITGAAVLGAGAVYALLRLRQASQDAEWEEHLDQAREQVRETRENLQEQASQTKEKVSKTAKDTGDKVKERVEATVGEAKKAQDNGRPST